MSVSVQYRHLSSGADDRTICSFTCGKNYINEYDIAETEKQKTHTQRVRIHEYTEIALN